MANRTSPWTPTEADLLSEADRAQERAVHGVPHIEDLHFHAAGDGTATIDESAGEARESTLSDDGGGWSVVSRWLCR